MKKCPLLLLIIASLFFSCDKKCCTPGPTIGFSALKDGNQWHGFPVDSVKNDTLTIYGKAESDMLKFRFLKNDGVLGMHTLDNYGTMYYVTTTNHGLLTYMLDNATVNTININHTYNSTSSYITGNFNLTFKLTTPTGNAAFDNTRVKFLNGVINFPLQN